MPPTTLPAEPEDRIDCLLVEQDAALRGPVAEALSAASGRFRLRTVNSGSSAMETLRAGSCDVVLLSIPSPLPSARTAVAEMVAGAAGIPVIAIGTLPEEEAAVELLRCGAQDYLRNNPAVVAALPRILRYAAERRRNADRTARAMNHAQDLESLLRAILSVTEAPLLVAADGGSVVAASAAFATAFGWSSSTADLPILDDLISPCEPPSPDGMPHPALVRCGNGHTLPARQRVAVTSMDGRPWRIVGLVPDPARDSGILTAARLLAGLTGGETTLLAGRLQLIGLDEVRERLGAEWERWSDRAYSIAEKVIRTRIRSEDVFARNKNGDFIVCFSSLGGEAAWYKAQAIAREIREKLIGDSQEGEFAEVRLETHTLAVTEGDLAGEVDIASLLSRKLDEEASRLRDNQARILREAYEQAVLVPQRVYTAGGAPAPAMTAGLDAESAMRLEALRNAGGNNQLSSEIDLLVLDRSIDYVSRSLERGDQRVLIVPLHHATLQQQKTRDTYIRMCRKLPEAVRGAIGFSIREIPEHVHAGRVCDLVGQLRNFARLRMLHLTRADLQGINLRDAGVSVVALHYLALAAALRNRPATVLALVQEIQMQRARFVVTYVPDSAGARKAVEHGATMVAFDPARVR